jgi:hypothetical protein
MSSLSYLSSRKSKSSLQVCFSTYLLLAPSCLLLLRLCCVTTIWQPLTLSPPWTYPARPTRNQSRAINPRDIDFETSLPHIEFLSSALQFIKMPSSEKRRLRASYDNEQDTIPADSPPSYENTILPSSNPWTDTPTRQAASPVSPVIDPQSQVPSQPSLSTPRPPAISKISIPSQNPLTALSRLATVPFSKYRVPNSTLADDLTTLTTTSPDLTTTSSSSPESRAELQRNIVRFLTEQASLPPKPVMIIRGTHLGHAAAGTAKVVDFELRFNLSCLLDLGGSGDISGSDDGPGDGPQRASSAGRRRRGGRIKVKPYVPGSTNGSPKQLSREDMDLSPLELWVKKFCEDKAENRRYADSIFILFSRFRVTGDPWECFVLTICTASPYLAPSLL